jgi:sporulation protein YunB
MNWKYMILITLIILIIAFFIHNTLTPIFISIAEIEAIRISNKAINEAVSEEAETIRYDDMIKYVYNNEGEISLMQPNIKYINKFISEVSLKIQRNLVNVTRMNVSIPFFSITGIELLSGLGPDLKAKIIPIGFTTPPEVKDSFLTAGINQTRHKIYLQVVVQLKLIVPFNSKLVDIRAQVPVTEVVIIGRVPHVYIGLNRDDIQGIINGDLTH